MCQIPLAAQALPVCSPTHNAQFAGYHASLPSQGSAVGQVIGSTHHTGQHHQGRLACSLGAPGLAEAARSCPKVLARCWSALAQACISCWLACSRWAACCRADSRGSLLWASCSPWLSCAAAASVRSKSGRALHGCTWHCMRDQLDKKKPDTSKQVGASLGRMSVVLASARSRSAASEQG